MEIMDFIFQPEYLYEGARDDLGAEGLETIHQIHAFGREPTVDARVGMRGRVRARVS